MSLSNIFRYPHSLLRNVSHVAHVYFLRFLTDFLHLQTRIQSGNTPTPASFHLSTCDWLVQSNYCVPGDCQSCRSRLTCHHWLQLSWKGRGSCCPLGSRRTLKHRVISVASFGTVKRRELGVDGVRGRKNWRLLLTVGSSASLTRQPCPLSSACSSVSLSALLRPSNEDFLQVGMLSCGGGVRTTVSPAGS